MRIYMSVKVSVYLYMNIVLYNKHRTEQQVRIQEIDDQTLHKRYHNVICNFLLKFKTRKLKRWSNFSQSPCTTNTVSKAKAKKLKPPYLQFFLV